MQPGMTSPWRSIWRAAENKQGRVRVCGVCVCELAQCHGGVEAEAVRERGYVALGVWV